MNRLLKISAFCICLASIFTSCHKGGSKSSWKKKDGKSDVTGWHYNDKDQGGYYVPKPKDVKTGPGLVFVQGGTFTMGSAEEDVMGD